MSVKRERVAPMEQVEEANTASHADAVSLKSAICVKTVQLIEHGINARGS